MSQKVGSIMFTFYVILGTRFSSSEIKQERYKTELRMSPLYFTYFVGFESHEITLFPSHTVSSDANYLIGDE